MRDVARVGVLGRIVGDDHVLADARPAAPPRSMTVMPSSVTAKALAAVGGERDGHGPKPDRQRWSSAWRRRRVELDERQVLEPSYGSAFLHPARVGPGDGPAAVAARRSSRSRRAATPRIVCGCSSPPAPARSTVASSDSTFSTITASSLRRDRGHVGGRVARLDGVDLQRRRVDVGDAAALRVGDPDEVAGRDRDLVRALQLRLGRQRRAARAAVPPPLFRRCRRR